VQLEKREAELNYTKTTEEFKLYKENSFHSTMVSKSKENNELSNLKDKISELNISLNEKNT